MEIGYPVGALDGWTRFEQRLVLSSLTAHLLEPTAKRRRRRRIHTTLLAGELPALEAEAKQDQTRLAGLQKIKSDLNASISEIAKSRAVHSYKGELLLDLNQKKLKDQRDERLRWLLGTALTVRVMHDAALRGNAIGTTAAREEIIRGYKANPMFAVNDKDLRASWTYGRRVASLAAALLECISKQKLGRFEIDRQLKSKRAVLRFFRYALYYEQYLLKPRTNPKLRFSIAGLVQIPPEFKIEPLAPQGELWLPRDPKRLKPISR